MGNDELKIVMAPHGGHGGGHHGGGFGGGHHMAAPVHHHVAAPMHHHVAAPVHHRPPSAPIHHNPPPMARPNPIVGPAPMMPIGPAPMNPPPMGGPAIVPIFMPMGGRRRDVYVYENYNRPYVDYHKIEQDSKRDKDIARGKASRQEGDPIAAMKFFNNCQPKYYPEDKDAFQKEVLDALLAGLKRNREALYPIQVVQEAEEKYQERADQKPLLSEVKLLKEKLSTLEDYYYQAVGYFELNDQLSAQLKEISDDLDFLKNKEKKLKTELVIQNALNDLQKVRQDIRKELNNEQGSLGILTMHFGKAASQCHVLVENAYQADHYRQVATQYDELSVRYQHYRANLDKWSNPVDLFKNELTQLKGRQSLFTADALRLLQAHDSYQNFFLSRAARENFMHLTPAGMKKFQEYIKDWLERELVPANKLYHPSFWCSSHTHFEWQRHFDIMPFDNALQQCSKYQDLSVDAIVNGESGEQKGDQDLPPPYPVLGEGSMGSVSDGPPSYRAM